MTILYIVPFNKQNKNDTLQIETKTDLKRYIFKSSLKETITDPYMLVFYRLKCEGVHVSVVKNRKLVVFHALPPLNSAKLPLG